MQYVAYANFSCTMLVADRDPETARRRASERLTYAGTTWRDHIDGVTVIEMDEETFVRAVHPMIDWPLHIASRHGRVVPMPLVAA